MTTKRISLVLAALLGGGARLLSKNASDRISSKQSNPEEVSTAGETIRLVGKEEHTWLDAASMQRAVDALSALGFCDAGMFSIDRMPGITLRLFVNEASQCYAAVYEHSRAGHWVHLSMRYKDGSSVTYSNTKNPNLDHSPKHPTHYFVGADAAELFRQATSEPRDRTLKSISPADVIREFEDLWVEHRKWRERSARAPSTTLMPQPQIQPSPL